MNMIRWLKLRYSAKSTHLHKDENNFKRNKVMKKTKMVSRVEFNESLNLTHVYYH